LDADTDSRWVFNFDGYAEEHGEPGGLAFGAGPDYNVDREATTRFFDRFELERYFASLAWERDFSENTALTVTGWGGYYSRFSKRQRGGGFGTLPTGANANSNTIEHQEFYTASHRGAAAARLDQRRQTHTLAGGVQLYHTGSPRTDKRGATPDADDGQLRNEASARRSTRRSSSRTGLSSRNSRLPPACASRTFTRASRKR
jgi:outer membrane receptor for Fe3+-dicitrate